MFKGHAPLFKASISQELMQIHAWRFCALFIGETNIQEVHLRRPTVISHGLTPYKYHADSTLNMAHIDYEECEAHAG